MNNKIGYKTKSYKNENYQLATIEKQSPEVAEISENEILQQLGYKKAIQLLKEFLHGNIRYSGNMNEELHEIRKHFFGVDYK